MIEILGEELKNQQSEWKNEITSLTNNYYTEKKQLYPRDRNGKQTQRKRNGKI